MKIPILGSYGTFGGRLARLLSGESSLTLIIAGRSAGKAMRFCADLTPGAARIPAVVNANANVKAQIGALQPDRALSRLAGPVCARGHRRRSRRLDQSFKRGIALHACPHLYMNERDAATH